MSKLHRALHHPWLKARTCYGCTKYINGSQCRIYALNVFQIRSDAATATWHLLAKEAVHDEFLHAFLDVFKLLVGHVPPELAHLHLSCNELDESRRKYTVGMS